jgi:hypothetical protein
LPTPFCQPGQRTAAPVAPRLGAVAAQAALDEPLPDTPGDPAATLELLDRVGTPATMAMAGPRFFGFVIGAALPVAVAANWLAGATLRSCRVERAVWRSGLRCARYVCRIVPARAWRGQRRRAEATENGAGVGGTRIPGMGRRGACAYDSACGPRSMHEAPRRSSEP